MSWYGNSEKDNMLDLLEEFLETHKASELLEIVADAIRHTEDE